MMEEIGPASMADRLAVPFVRDLRSLRPLRTDGAVHLDPGLWKLTKECRFCLLVTTKADKRDQATAKLSERDSPNVTSSPKIIGRITTERGNKSKSERNMSHAVIGD
jgi:hypothetical protein